MNKLKIDPGIDSRAMVLLLLAALPLPSAGRIAVHDALGGSALGLYQAQDFRLVNAECKDCGTSPQALWYFRDDLVAVPRGKVVGFDAHRRVQDDVRLWANSHAVATGEEPALIWIGSPQFAEGRLSDDGTALIGGDGSRLGLAMTTKIPSNRSYYDASSTRYFSARPVKARGQMEPHRFVARTLWPVDFALTPDKMSYRPLADNESLGTLVRADNGGARAPFAARVLWQRDATAVADWAGRPVIALLLNGAQGDDDEAHGGHFAMATGRFGEHGEWDDWLVNNFYNLGSVSEKGIIAATLPMDAYQADLNSGQSWYRPSYLLVAVLKQDRVAARYQEAIGRVFNHFYRQDFHYHHAVANCAGINLRTLRALGWRVPQRGATGRLKGLIALPYMAIKDLSLDSGTKAFDYLETEQTDLYPFVAFDAVGQDLLQRIVKQPSDASEYERLLAEDVEAVIFVRVPQFPSSRAFGQAPVASIDEYMARVPEDKSKWKIIPVGQRRFPDELIDPQAPGEPLLPSTYALFGYGITIAAMIAVFRPHGSRRQPRSRT